MRLQRTIMSFYCKKKRENQKKYNSRIPLAIPVKIQYTKNPINYFYRKGQLLRKVSFIIIVRHLD